MASRTGKRVRIGTLWNIATCAVIVGVVFFLAARTANPILFVVGVALLALLALLIRRYRHERRRRRGTPRA